MTPLKGLFFSAFAAIVAVIALVVIKPDVSLAVQVLIVIGAAVIAVPYTLLKSGIRAKTREAVQRTRD